VGKSGIAIPKQGKEDALSSQFGQTLGAAGRKPDLEGQQGSRPKLLSSEHDAKRVHSKPICIPLGVRARRPAETIFCFPVNTGNPACGVVQAILSVPARRACCLPSVLGV
jgi:hypothetical protein